MNILTFDIEEWYLERHVNGNRSKKFKEYDYYLGRILDLLDERGLKATFFCLGGMAKDFPEVVLKIAGNGHHIGCHSNRHVWLNKMTPEEVMEDTRIALDQLEQRLGQKVVSYRAPAFSIGQKNKWAFDILAECGITSDASIFPAKRDFGGFPNFGCHRPCIIDTGNCLIKEFPIQTIHLLGREIAYSGGGYFRFFPLWFTQRELNRSDYAMLYFHIGDLIPEESRMRTKEEYEEYFREPGTLFNRTKRYVKANLGKKHAYAKLGSLIRNHEFVSLSEAEETISEWNTIHI
ncbi:MAG: polysaccharide deacetylase family protein [Bacteroidaceae bacterium]|nr:polysaccharide deacetylase family protein [Bacteroidaceae bacterium]